MDGIQHQQREPKDVMQTETIFPTVVKPYMRNEHLSLNQVVEEKDPTIVQTETSLRVATIEPVENHP